MTKFRHAAACAAVGWLVLCAQPAISQDENKSHSAGESVEIALSSIPDDPKLDQAPSKYLAVFEIDGDAIVGKSVRDPEAGELGIQCWNRVVALIPKQYREGIVQFNIEAGRRWAGRLRWGREERRGSQGVQVLDRQVRRG